MTYRVIIQPQAESEIEANARWWAEHHSVEQAIRWLNAIQDQIRSLSSSPFSNAVSPERDKFPYEIRDKLVGLGSRPSYRAVFTVVGDDVHVLTFRRGSQDRIAPDQVEGPSSS